METLNWKHSETWYLIPTISLEFETIWNGETDLIIGLKWFNRSSAIIINIKKKTL